MDISYYASELALYDGIWFSKTKGQVSYPDSGYDECFELEDASFWFQHRNNCIIELVKKYSDNKLFFDIGGGNGFVSLGLVKNNINTVLVEPGIVGILNAKERGLENLVCSSLQDAKFKPSVLPNVGLFDVVEHIEDDIAFLKMINFYMQPQGNVFITVPAYSWLWSNEDSDAGHYRRYTLGSITKKLQEAGFRIVYKSYFFTLLPVPIFMFRSLPSWFKLRGKNQRLEKHKSEHDSGILTNVLNKLLRIEVSRIIKGKRNIFGGSCIIVAQKN